MRDVYTDICLRKYGTTTDGLCEKRLLKNILHPIVNETVTRSKGRLAIVPINRISRRQQSPHDINRTTGNPNEPCAQLWSEERDIARERFIATGTCKGRMCVWRFRKQRRGWRNVCTEIQVRSPQKSLL